MYQSSCEGFFIDKKINPKLIYLKNPEIVGYCSIDASKKFQHDSSQLRYLIPFAESPVCYDLNEGMSKVRKTTNTIENEKLDHLFRWILLNKTKILANPQEEKLLKPDFISYEISLRQILQSPYDRQQQWIMCAAKFKGNIYLCQFKTEEDIKWELKMTERNRKMAFWRKRLKQYLLSDNPYCNSNTSTTTDESGEFRCIFQGQLNDHDLLYSTQMEGLVSTEKLKDPLPLDQLQFIKLKTDIHDTNRNKKYIRKQYKTLYWCVTGYLACTKDMIIGYRDNDGIVRRLEKQKISDLAIQSKNYWDLNVCLDAGNDFLNHVKDIVKEDYDKVVYKFVRLPNNNFIEVTKLPPSSEYAFLPEWYTSAVAA